MAATARPAATASSSTSAPGSDGTAAVAGSVGFAAMSGAPVAAREGSEFAAMLQRRQLSSHLGDPLRLQLGRDDALAFGPHRDDVAPRIGDQRVAPGAPAVLVPAALRRGRDVALVLDRAGAQQEFPVRLAGRVGEGR